MRRSRGAKSPALLFPMKTLEHQTELAQALEKLAFWAEVVLEGIPPAMESRDTLALGDALDVAEEVLKGGREVSEP